MTDLDRKIAELKGWRPGPIEDGWPKECGDCLVSPDGGCAYVEGQESPLWSQSDTKAFELVDELAEELDGQDKHPGDVKIGVSLTRERGCGRWMAALCASNWVHGSGETRAEAICRAYIALKEWEGKK